jgi:hypothetical protein
LVNLATSVLIVVKAPEKGVAMVPVVAMLEMPGQAAKVEVAVAMSYCSRQLKIE